MSYPKKISRETILEVAMARLESHGLPALSMRTLATELGVTPNALYRYFASKADLEYAMADEAGKLLYQALSAAASGQPTPQALEGMAMAYMRFARQSPELYAIKMRHGAPDAHKPASHDQVWQLVTDLAQSWQTPWDAKDLALTLWAFLHGVVELDRARLLEGRTPEATIHIGLEVMLSGLLARLAQPPR
jgi:AcrR family transcriptional regulator